MLAFECKWKTGFKNILNMSIISVGGGGLSACFL